MTLSNEHIKSIFRLGLWVFVLLTQSVAHSAESNRYFQRTIDFDRHGRILAVTTPDNVLIRHQYDKSGRVRQISSSDLDSKTQSKPLQETNFKYDKNGDILEAQGEGGKTSYQYDVYRRLSQIRFDYPGVGFSVKYAYDPWGRQTSVLITNEREHVVSDQKFDYDIHDRLRYANIDGFEINFQFDKRLGFSRTLTRNIKTEYNFHNNGNLKSVAHAQDGKIIAQFDYEFDDFNHLRRTVESDSNNRLNTTEFVYDKDRLIGVKDSNKESIDYSFDNKGRLSQIIGSGNPLMSLDRNNLNQLTRYGTYSLNWDSSGRVSVISSDESTTTISYDSFGRTKSKEFQSDGHSAHQEYIYSAEGFLIGIKMDEESISIVPEPFRFESTPKTVFGKGFRIANPVPDITLTFQGTDIDVLLEDGVGNATHEVKIAWARRAVRTPSLTLNTSPLHRNFPDSQFSVPSPRKTGSSPFNQAHSGTEFQSNQFNARDRLSEIQAKRFDHQRRLFELQSKRFDYQSKLFDLQSKRFDYQNRLFDLQSRRSQYQSRLFDQLRSLPQYQGKNIEFGYSNEEFMANERFWESGEWKNLPYYKELGLDLSKDSMTADELLKSVENMPAEFMKVAATTYKVTALNFLRQFSLPLDFMSLKLGPGMLTSFARGVVDGYIENELNALESEIPESKGTVESLRAWSSNVGTMEDISGFLGFAHGYANNVFELKHNTFTSIRKPFWTDQTGQMRMDHLDSSYHLSENPFKAAKHVGEGILNIRVGEFGKSMAQQDLQRTERSTSLADDELFIFGGPGGPGGPGHYFGGHAGGGSRDIYDTLNDARNNLGNKWGPKGVKFDKPAQFVGAVGSIEGISFDSESKRLMLIGDGNPSLPPIRLDDFLVAIKIVYGGGDPSKNFPMFSLEPAQSDNYASSMILPWYSHPILEGTHMGDVMLRSDWLLKEYAFGVIAGYDGSIKGKRISNVPGYRSCLEMLQRNPHQGLASLFYITPDEMHLAKKGNVLVFERESMKIITKPLDSSRSRDRIADAFASHFSTHYDSFAHESPEFEEVREAAKVVAIVMLLKQQGVQINDFDLDWDMKVHNPDLVQDSIPALSVSSAGGIWGVPSFKLVGGVELNPRPDSRFVSSQVQSIGEAIERLGNSDNSSFGRFQIRTSDGMKQRVFSTLPITKGSRAQLYEAPVYTLRDTTYSFGKSGNLKSASSEKVGAADFEYDNSGRLSGLTFDTPSGWRYESYSRKGNEIDRTISPAGDVFERTTANKGMLTEHRINNNLVLKTTRNATRNSINREFIEVKKRRAIGDLSGTKRMESVVAAETYDYDPKLGQMRYSRKHGKIESLLTTYTNNTIRVESDSSPRTYRETKADGRTILESPLTGRVEFEPNDEDFSYSFKSQTDNHLTIQLDPNKSSAPEVTPTLLVTNKIGSAEATFVASKDRIEIKDIYGDKTTASYKDGRIQNISSPHHKVRFEYDTKDSLTAIHQDGSPTRRFDWRFAKDITRVTTWIEVL